MGKIVIPTNVDINSCAVCIKSNYYKMGCVNFQPQVGGASMQPQELWRLCMKNVLPMNPMPDGSCRTIKSQYYKNSLGNFIRGGGYGATAVIEIEYESESLPPLQK